MIQGGSQRNKDPAFPCAADWIKAYQIDLIFNYFRASMAEGVPGSIGATCHWASPPVFPEIAVGTTKGGWLVAARAHFFSSPLGSGEAGGSGVGWV